MAGFAELTFFQASRSALPLPATYPFLQKLFKKKRAMPVPWQTTGRRELLYKMKVTLLSRGLLETLTLA